MAPSLTTTKGQLNQGGDFSTKASEVLDGGETVAVVELRYETATTLLLRGILKRDNPVHRAILQQFPETAEQEDRAERGAAGPSHAGHKRARRLDQDAGTEHESERRQRQGGAAGASVKQEGAGPRLKRQEKEELVDLTKGTQHPWVPQGYNKNDEVLAARKANKLLECDLTADEELAWRAVKKEVHRV